MGRLGRFGLAAALLAAITILSGPSAAGASNVLDLERSKGALWASTHVGEAQDSIVVTFLAPRADGSGRFVWQKCSFRAPGAASYRCGIDVARGSLADKRSGTWQVRVLVDGAETARRLFSL